MAAVWAPLPLRRLAVTVQLVVPDAYPSESPTLEITSSNFPKFVRNLNTGGNNYDESEGRVATNSVHHSPERASYIELPVVRSR